MPTGEAREARAYVDCRLAGDKSADCGKQQALEEYYAAVQAYWSRLCRADLGCWALESGISEFRLSARVLVDPSKALSAIVLSRPATSAERRVGIECVGPCSSRRAPYHITKQLITTNRQTILFSTNVSIMHSH